MIVLGDLNDTVHSVTTEILTGTPVSLFFFFVVQIPTGD